MSLLRRHPSQRELQVWLDTGGPEAVTQHVGQCERCAQSLEQIAAREDAERASADRGDNAASSDETSVPGGRKLVQALSSLWEAPSDLHSRVIERVDSRIRGEHDLAVLAGLFTIGVETAQLMIPSASGGRHRDEDSRTDQGDGLA